MSDNKKRKALDQLSPYSQQDEESLVLNKNESKKEVEKKNEEKIPRVRRRAKANFGKVKGMTTDPDLLKGILPSFKIVASQPEENDNISGLNKCFLTAITKVINKQSNKDLRPLIKQYELYIKKIDQ